MKRLVAVILLAACGVENPTPTEQARTVEEFLTASGVSNLRANRPFRDDLRVWTWRDGRLSSVPAQRKDGACYFFADATIEGEPATVALRTCDVDGRPEIGGVAFSARGQYELRQTEVGVEFDRVRGAEGTCGVQHAVAPPLSLPVPASTRIQALSTGDPRFVEVFVGRDVQLLDAIASGEYAPDPVMSVHAAAALYDRTSFAQRILPILTGILDAEGENPWGNTSVYFGEARTGQYLDNINAWVEDNRSDLPEFDEMTVLSGYDFFGSTVGLANVGGACDETLSAVVIEGLGNDPSIAQTLGHELGHTLGMWHDGESNPCPSSGFVMTAIYDPDGPFATEFSSCSVQYANPFLLSSQSDCITAEAQAAHPEPLCGDGKVEGNEQCDCGPLGCQGRNPCCTDTCTLKVGATCSPDNPCCDPQTCAVATTPRVCRAAKGTCDVEELCVGAVCPPDEVVATGQSCNEDGWQGACFVGECVTRGGSCDLLAPNYVLDTPSYADRCADEGDCGPIPCLSDGACVILQEDAFDGTPCGQGRQCFNGTCQTSSTLPGFDGCADSRGCDVVIPEPEPQNNQTTEPDAGTPGPDESDAGTPNPDDPGITVELVDQGGQDGCSTSGATPAFLALFAAWLLRRRHG